MNNVIPPTYIRGTLAAGESKPYPVTGDFLRVATATGALKIGFDLGTPLPSRVGRWYQFAAGDMFAQITVENPGGSAVSFELEASRRMISGDDSLNVVGGDIARDGTDGTGIVAPAGAVGIRGWLSGIYSALSGGTININTTGMSTEVTLAALKARADLLATEAKLEQVRALLAGTLAVSGPITDAQFRTSAVANSFATGPDLNVPNNTATLAFAAFATRKACFICNPSDAFPIRVGDANVGAARGLLVPPGGSVELATTAAVYVYQSSGAAMNLPYGSTSI